MNWYKLAVVPKIILSSWSDDGQLVVYITGKKYVYANVGQWEYNALSRFVQYDNLSRAFAMLKSFKQIEPQRQQKEPIKQNEQRNLFAQRKDENMKELIILRSPSGAGKSTLAKKLIGNTGQSFETDEFFMRDGKYQFNAALLGRAHKWNHDRVKEAMQQGISPVVVANTNTTMGEMSGYVLLGKKYNYTIKFVEPDWDKRLKNPDGTWNYDFIKSVQDKRRASSPDKDIPDEVIRRMIQRYNYKLPNETDEEFTERILASTKK